MPPQQILDLQSIPQSDCPLLVFVNQAESEISCLIEISEDGSCNLQGEVSHMMTITDQGFFNSQNPGGLKILPMTTYMREGVTIIFVSFLHSSIAANHAMKAAVNSKLGEPYDWLQILGQDIGLDFLHFPGSEDCSEEGVREMKVICPFLPKTDASVILQLDNQSNPQQVLNFCIKNPAVFGVYGTYKF